jgi:hypothetical protein
VVVVVILVVVVVLVVELVVVVEVLVAASVLGTSVVASFTSDDSVVVAVTDCNSVGELDVLTRVIELVEAIVV